MSYSPYFKSPFSDLTCGLLSHQWYGECRDFEMKMMDCLEAYGLQRGIQKCDLLIQDFRECAGRKKQMQRSLDMRWERNRQYWTGERKREDLYAPSPKPDTF